MTAADLIPVMIVVPTVNATERIVVPERIDLLDSIRDFDRQVLLYKVTCSADIC